MRSHLLRRLFVILIAFAAFASACGGGGDDDSSADASSGDGAADTSDDGGDDSSDDTGSDGGAGEDESTDDDGGDSEADAGSGDDSEAATEPEPEEEPAPDYATLRVPDDFATIQEAVDAAQEGDLVLISPGVYHESVSVETDNLVIRGTDRNEVILDGEHKEDMANGVIVFANGVAVENLTVRNYFSNGVFFTGDYDSDFVLHGYRASYITAHNNRKYGIYAFNAEYGLIEHSYAAGHTDSGYYVGQCQPCMAVVQNNISENNTLGYSGTNAGGELYIVNNEFRHNRAGVVPNTLDSEELAPQRDAVFAGNWIHHTGNLETTRGSDIWELAFGVGMVLPGTNDNLVMRNLIENNATGGLAVSFLPDDNIWYAEDNEIRENVLRDNLVDIVVVAQQGGDSLGNCFADNTFETSRPENIETVMPCGQDHGEVEGLTGIDVFAPPAADATIPYEEIAAPGADSQPNMPDADSAPPRSADVLPEFDDFDLDAIEVPSGVG